MTKWEYLHVTNPDDQFLSDRGLEGWELVAIIGEWQTFYFKREVQQYGWERV